MKTWRRFKEQCETSKVIPCLLFLIKNYAIELSEWLHESYLKNNEVIHKLVDVFVTLECIQYLYILCIVPQCLFREVSLM